MVDELFNWLLLVCPLFDWDWFVELWEWATLLLLPLLCGVDDDLLFDLLSSFVFVSSVDCVDDWLSLCVGSVSCVWSVVSCFSSFLVSLLFFYFLFFVVSTCDTWFVL